GRELPLPGLDPLPLLAFGPAPRLAILLFLAVADAGEDRQEIMAVILGLHATPDPGTLVVVIMSFDLLPSHAGLTYGCSIAPLGRPDSSRFKTVHLLPHLLSGAAGRLAGLGQI